MRVHWKKSLLGETRQTAFVWFFYDKSQNHSTKLVVLQFDYDSLLNQLELDITEKNKSLNRSHSYEQFTDRFKPWTHKWVNEIHNWPTWRLFSIWKHRAAFIYGHKTAKDEMCNRLWKSEMIWQQSAAESTDLWKGLVGWKHPKTQFCRASRRCTIWLHAWHCTEN